MNILVLVLLGLCFGSFVNALVWRLHQQSKPQKSNKAHQYSVARGRSMCVQCKHRLTAYDLLPVLSWILLGGKCRYCKKPISWQYPAVELTTAGAFVTSYLLWPQPLQGLEIAQLGVWLACIVGLIALAVYDIRWMLLPNRIIFPLYSLAGLFVVLQMIQEKSFYPLLDAVMSVLVGGGIFYVLFQVSKGKWIGGGDVKLGFLLGALISSPLKAMLMLFIASVLGCILALPLILSGKADRSSRIPFGPFLIISGIIVVLIGSDITDWYFNLLIG